MLTLFMHNACSHVLPHLLSYSNDYILIKWEMLTIALVALDK